MDGAADGMRAGSFDADICVVRHRRPPGLNPDGSFGVGRPDVAHASTGQRPLPWLCDRKIVRRKEQPFQARQLYETNFSPVNDLGIEIGALRQEKGRQIRRPSSQVSICLQQQKPYATALKPISDSTGLMAGRAFNAGRATASTSSMRLA